MKEADECPDCSTGTLAGGSRFARARGEFDPLPKGLDVVRCVPASDDVESCGHEWAEDSNGVWRRLTK